MPYTPDDILQLLEPVCDPEVPVLSVQDLGIIRQINLVSDTEVDIDITPTYSGCPAMQTIATAIRLELMGHGIKANVKEILSPAWTTDWMSHQGKEKLKEYGIAPPQYLVKNDLGEAAIVPCPRCESTDTQLLSQFGSTSCKALYRCQSCLEPFDYFKCH